MAVLAPSADGMLARLPASGLPLGGGPLEVGEKDLGVAEWAWLHQRAAGAGTDTLPSAPALFLPLKGARGRVGILAVYPSATTRLADPDERQLLDAFGGLLGSALERTQLVEEARKAEARRSRPSSCATPSCRPCPTT